MSSLFALLSQQTPNLQTRKALILVGLQNDFVLPEGKLPISDASYLKRIPDLIRTFREFGDIIWVRTEYKENRPVDGASTPGDTVVISGHSSDDDEESPSDDGPRDKRRLSSASSKRFKSSSPKSSAAFSRPDSGEDDEELFLTRTATREPCCVRGTHGAEFVECVQSSIIPKKDLQVTQSHYSAFGATSLLLTLRSKLITELFVCGNITNLSVYATAVDAARYGIKIILVKDCLGHRTQERHDYALRQLHDIMDADIMTSEQAIDFLRNPPVEDDLSEDAISEDEAEDLDEEEEEEEEEEGDDGLEEKEAAQEAQVRLMQKELTYGQPTGLDSGQSPSGALEVDSDDSDDDDDDDDDGIPPFVRGNMALGTMPGLRSSLDRYSRSTAKPQSTSSPGSKAPSSILAQGRHDNVSKTTQQDDHGRTDKHVERRHKPSPSNNHDKLATLQSPDLLERSQQPRLELIDEPSASDKFDTVLRPKYQESMVSPDESSLYAKASTKLEKINPHVQGVHAYEARSQPLFGADEKEESAGSRILQDLLDDDIAATVFEKLKSEVNWQTMLHQTGEVPRLVCCQGAIGEDGSMPVYRHPSDQTIPLGPWTPMVNVVKETAEKIVGHPLNHALIQLYRSGNDYISEHTDKTLDIMHDSNIVNVSFGAQRTMRLRTKRDTSQRDVTRTTHRVPMPHNSMLIMSLPTNARYLHGINWDRRPACELSEAETAFGGQRISLTFRHITTFLNRDSTEIWGQGATGRTPKDAHPVVNGDPVQSERLVRAFGRENQASSIVWEDIYGGGFDVLHLK